MPAPPYWAPYDGPSYPVFIDGTKINPSGYRSKVRRREELAKLIRSSPQMAKAIVNQAAPIASSNPATEPAGWNGGSEATGGGAVYAGAKQGNAVVVTIGLLVLLEGIAGIIYGGQYRSFPTAFSQVGLHAGAVPLGISRNDVFVASAVLVVALALAALFRFTSVGLRLRASAFNPYAARLLGVRVGRVLTLGWALAGLIGALAGLLVSPDTFLYPSSMDSIFVLGFTAAVIGGLDSPVGAIVGGLILGVVLNYVGGYLGSNLVPIFGLVALMAVLLIRPSGLFSVTHERRV